MAVPKRRHSHARTRWRRANDALAVPQAGKCSNCGSPSMPHEICGYCGFYKGKSFIEFEEDEEEGTEGAGGAEE